MSGDDWNDPYWEGDYDDYGESDDPCDNCGIHCPHWGGDGLCMLIIEQQSRIAEYYKEHHVRESVCPICKEQLKEYDLYASEDPKPFVVSAGWFFPTLWIDIMGVLWLNKGLVHKKDGVFHVWIEWGVTGREDKLLKYISQEEHEESQKNLYNWLEKISSEELKSG